MQSAIVKMIKALKNDAVRVFARDDYVIYAFFCHVEKKCENIIAKKALTLDFRVTKTSSRSREDHGFTSCRTTN